MDDRMIEVIDDFEEARHHVLIAAATLETWYHIGTIEDIVYDLRDLATQIDRHI